MSTISKVVLLKVSIYKQKLIEEGPCTTPCEVSGQPLQSDPLTSTFQELLLQLRRAQIWRSLLKTSNVEVRKLGWCLRNSLTRCTRSYPHFIHHLVKQKQLRRLSGAQRVPFITLLFSSWLLHRFFKYLFMNSESGCRSVMLPISTPGVVLALFRHLGPPAPVPASSRELPMGRQPILHVLRRV